MSTAKPSATPAEPTGARPIGTDELQGLFASFEGRSGVVLAVSGGADSTALMLLAARWREAGSPVRLLVVCVDHGLRADAAQESALVARQALALGLPCRILLWHEARPGTGLQRRARAARYRLIEAHCQEQGCDALVTAHTLEDQAETVLMRGLRGSGLDGLAGMQAATPRGALTYLRPLLDVSKARLVATLREANWTWSEDPSNQDQAFERVRLRQALGHLDPGGLLPARLARLATRAARASSALDALAEDLLRSCRAFGVQGEGVSLDADTLMHAPSELRLRVLDLALRQVSPTDGFRRLDRLEALLGSVEQAYRQRVDLHRTVWGCRVSLKGGSLAIRAETGRRRGLPPVP